MSVQRELPDVAWDDWVRRVIIHVPHYLSHSGKETAGGRQRKVRDLSVLIREKWGRNVVIVQKAATGFETKDSNGIPVIGLKVPLRVGGDPLFGFKSRRLLRNGDAWLSIGQEDAWPFFVGNSKGIHTGVWWDGPHPAWKQYLNAKRTMAMIRAYRTMWCVDTNIINWIRCQGSEGYKLSAKCEYIHNCVDLDLLPPVRDRERPNAPVKILFARRYEPKRGGELFLDALAYLRDRGFSFLATLSSAIGQDGSQTVSKHIASRKLESYVQVSEHGMDSILTEYCKADLSVIPTLWSEGTSYSCVESIASGVPAVVTPVGGLANLILPGFNGHIAAPRAPQLAESIIYVSEPSRWKILRLNCLAMRPALSKASWTEKALRWLRN